MRQDPKLGPYVNVQTLGIAGSGDCKEPGQPHRMTVLITGADVRALPASRGWPQALGQQHLHRAPRGRLPPQHLLNLGLGLCDSLLNLLCYPPPGLCSRGIFILRGLRLMNEALESCSGYHTKVSATVHPLQVSPGLLSDQVCLPPLTLPNTHLHPATPHPEPTWRPAPRSIVVTWGK